ncbi:hypothetical protein BH09ACT7_BH09ACT7_58630 [soil metagenome]
MAAENEPWYRQPAATFTAGGVGLLVIAALIVTVIQFSDDWGQPSTSVFTTQATTEQTLRSTQPFVITPSDTSTSYPTSALSTTEIGLPGETTSGTDTTSPSDSTPTSDNRFPGTRPVVPAPGAGAGDGPSTTKRRPRLNETRTLGP